jgi:hypothetical protein
MSGAVEMLRQATAAIWTTPPKGLAGLSTLNRPPSGDLPKRLYCNFDLYGTAGVLYQLREALAHDAVSLASAALFVEMVASQGMRRLRTWGFDDEAAVLEAALPLLVAAPDAATLKAGLDELAIFLNRIGAWVDATIPWSELGKIAPLPPPGAAP